MYQCLKDGKPFSLRHHKFYIVLQQKEKLLLEPLPPSCSPSGEASPCPQIQPEINTCIYCIGTWVACKSEDVTIYTRGEKSGDVSIYTTGEKKMFPLHLVDDFICSLKKIFTRLKKTNCKPCQVPTLASTQDSLPDTLLHRELFSSLHHHCIVLLLLCLFFNRTRRHGLMHT